MKNFNDIYQKVYQENIHIEENRKVYLKQSRKKMLYTSIILAVIAVILIALNLTLLLPFEIIIGIFAILLSGSSQLKSYKKDYKGKIITSLVSNYDEHLCFNGYLSIPRNIYNNAEFEYYDRFHSNDYIHGKINGIIPIQLGDIHTENVHTDSDGHTTYTTVFRGLFSEITLPKSLLSTIKIRSDKGMLGKFLSKKDQVEMDSQQFEKYFDVFTTDKILAVRILTSDIMNYMIDFKLQNKVTFELTIKNSSMYLRIHCDDMFEAKMSKSALDFETLHKYYKFLNFMCELNEKIYNIIQEKDI